MRNAPLVTPFIRAIGGQFGPRQSVYPKFPTETRQIADRFFRIASHLSQIPVYSCTERRFEIVPPYWAVHGDNLIFLFGNEEPSSAFILAFRVASSPEDIEELSYLEIARRPDLQPKINAVFKALEDQSGLPLHMVFDPEGRLGVIERVPVGALLSGVRALNGAVVTGKNVQGADVRPSEKQKHFTQSGYETDVVSKTSTLTREDLAFFAGKKPYSMTIKPGDPVDRKVEVKGVHIKRVKGGIPFKDPALFPFVKSVTDWLSDGSHGFEDLVKVSSRDHDRDGLDYMRRQAKALNIHPDVLYTAWAIHRPKSIMSVIDGQLCIDLHPQAEPWSRTLRSVLSFGETDWPIPKERIRYEDADTQGRIPSRLKTFCEEHDDERPGWIRLTVSVMGHVLDAVFLDASGEVEGAQFELASEAARPRFPVLNAIYFGPGLGGPVKYSELRADLKDFLYQEALKLGDDAESMTEPFRLLKNTYEAFVEDGELKVSFVPDNCDWWQQFRYAVSFVETDNPRKSLQPIPYLPYQKVETEGRIPAAFLEFEEKLRHFHLERIVFTITARGHIKGIDAVSVAPATIIDRTTEVETTRPVSEIVKAGKEPKYIAVIQSLYAAYLDEWLAPAGPAHHTSSEFKLTVHGVIGREADHYKLGYPQLAPYFYALPKNWEFDVGAGLTPTTLKVSFTDTAKNILEQLPQFFAFADRSLPHLEQQLIAVNDPGLVQAVVPVSFAELVMWLELQGDTEVKLTLIIRVTGQIHNVSVDIHRDMNF